MSTKRQAALLALLAAAAAAPGLVVPFLSDDWVNLATAGQGIFRRTAFGYYRPLTTASHWGDHRLFGLSPFLAHLFTLALIALAAALVVVLVRRVTSDARVSAATGILFALHPYHVENAAWVAARADVLVAVFLFGAFLAYDSWNRDRTGLPYAALGLLAAALLSKESAAAFPPALLALRLLQTGGSLPRAEWTRGIAPIAALTLLHFAVLRGAILGESGWSVLSGAGFPWAARLVNFTTAAVVPLHIERIEGAPRLFAILAVAAVAALAFAVRDRIRAAPRVPLAGALLFVISLAPTLLSFQERYFFFSAAFSALTLGWLLVHLPRRAAAVAWTLLIALWLGSLGEHWSGWLQAGAASRRLVYGLTRASEVLGVREIVVANLPYRVAGAPVGSSALESAIALSGGRSVRVCAATAIDVPTASADGLERPLAQAVERPPPVATVRLRLAPKRFARLFLPLDQRPNVVHEGECAAVTFDGAGGAIVAIRPAGDGRRAAYVWSDGALTRLF